MKNEATVQDEVRLDNAATNMGILWRNNVGVLFDKSGRPIRYGLANDSARMNEEVKSSDLIGGLPVTITPAMVGKTVFIFTAIECKAEGFTYNPNDKRQKAQNKYMEVVRKMGGIAGFASSVLEYREIVYNFYQRLIKP